MISTDFSPLVNHLWQTTFFAVVVWLLTIVLRKNPAAVRYWLWLLGSAKFLIPFALLVSLGGQLERRSAPATARPQLAAVVTQVSKSFSVPTDLSPLMSASTNGSKLSMILLAVWLCGIMLGLIFWVRLFRQIRAVKAAAKPLHLDLPIPVLSSSARLEPGVFGIFKPALILPDGIAERLTPAQLEAVLAHELCHVRRKDNLTAAVHMVVETIFWFHPMVWWIRKQLLLERERACDEQVVQALNDRQVYAEGILNVCKLYLESRLVCVSGITGGDLKRRVQRIMAQTAVCGLGWAKKALLVAIGAIAVAGPLMVGLLSAPRSRAQTEPRFEVASIKPASDDEIAAGDSGFKTGHGRAVGTNVTIKRCIVGSYHIGPGQVIGGPNWLDSDRFHIEAKAAESVNDDDILDAMLRNLLAERFHLAVHRETRDLRALVLVVSKQGPKLEKADGGDTFTDARHGALTLKNSNLDALAERLARTTDVPVVNQTGLAGVFNLRLIWTQDNDQPKPDGPPPLSIALQEQLGLQLKSQRVPVEVFVIDHVEKPTAN